MPKKELLFVVHHLTVGGVQKSLVSALRAIDYDKYNVTLYVRKNRLDIVKYIDERVSIVVNTINKHYYRMPYAIWLQLKTKLFGVLRLTKKEEDAKKHLLRYISDKTMIDEASVYFSKNRFDIAVSYIQSLTAQFVYQYVDAKKKIVFYQGSTDEWHDINSVFLPKYDTIVVEHDDIKQLLLEWYDKTQDNQVYVLENYTDRELLQRQSKEYDVKTYIDKITLCTCSRFSDVKGIDLAVEAAKILKNDGLRFIWYMVGDGPEMQRIESMIREYQLSDYVKLPGMQTNPYPYMAACDIYVQPSREEALSIAMLESKILCAPMVSTKTAGGLAMIREGENGVLADINPESIADKIALLMKNETLRKKIKSHLQSVDYSTEEERYKKDWEELLRN